MSNNESTPIINNTPPPQTTRVRQPESEFQLGWFIVAGVTLISGLILFFIIQHSLTPTNPVTASVSPWDALPPLPPTGYSAPPPMQNTVAPPPSFTCPDCNGIGRANLCPTSAMCRTNFALNKYESACPECFGRKVESVGGVEVDCRHCLGVGYCNGKGLRNCLWCGGYGRVSGEVAAQHQAAVAAMQERVRQADQALRDAPCDPANSLTPCYGTPIIDYSKMGRNAD